MSPTPTFSSCILPFYICVQLGAPCSSIQAFWHFCRIFYLYKWPFLELGGVYPLISVSFPGLIFSLWLYAMEFFQMDFWSCWSLPSWGPGPWSFFLLCSLLLGSWTPPSHGHKSHSCLQLSYLWEVLPYSCLFVNKSFPPRVSNLKFSLPDSQPTGEDIFFPFSQMDPILPNSFGPLKNVPWS